MTDLTDAMHEDLNDLLLRRGYLLEEMDELEVEIKATIDMIGMAEHMSEEFS